MQCSSGIESLGAPVPLLCHLLVLVASPPFRPGTLDTNWTVGNSGLPPPWIYCRLRHTHSPGSRPPMSALRVEPNLCHFRKRKLVSSQNGEAGGRDTFRRRWWPRPKRAVAVGLESRRQIQEGLGENQGTVMADWMWEMRIETAAPGDSKIY